MDGGVPQAWRDLADDLVAGVPANAAFLDAAIEALRSGSVDPALPDDAFAYSARLRATGMYPCPYYAAALAWALDVVVRQDDPILCARAVRRSLDALDQWRAALAEMGVSSGTA